MEFSRTFGRERGLCLKGARCYVLPPLVFLGLSREAVMGFGSALVIRAFLVLNGYWEEHLRLFFGHFPVSCFASSLSKHLLPFFASTLLSTGLIVFSHTFSTLIIHFFLSTFLLSIHFRSTLLAIHFASISPVIYFYFVLLLSCFL